MAYCLNLDGECTNLQSGGIVLKVGLEVLLDDVLKVCLEVILEVVL